MVIVQPADAGVDRGRTVASSRAEPSVATIAAPWTGVTLPDLFAATVQQNPAERAFADPDRALTYRDAARAVAALAGQFEEIGLDQGQRVLLVLPPTIEAPVAILAALQAGLIPCLMGAGSDGDTLKEAMAGCAVNVVVTVTAVGSVRPAERVRTAAAIAEGPRFILAFGERVPAGVIPIAPIEGPGEGPAIEVRRERGAATPTIWTYQPGRGGGWVEHSQEGLVAAALQVVLAGGMGSGRAILSTVAPMSHAGLAAGLVPALLTSGRYVLAGIFSGDRLLTMVRDHGRPHLIVPALLEPALAQAGLLGGGDIAATLLLHRPPTRLHRRDPVKLADSAVLDVVTLGEFGMIAAARRDGTVAVPCIDIRIPETEDGALVLGPRIGDGGALSLTGAAAGVPMGRALGAGDEIETGLALQLDGAGLIQGVSSAR